MLGRIMHIGDWVNLVGREGQVTNISLGHVTLQTREGDWLMVPNNLVAQKEIVNYSRPTRQHLCSVTIEAAFGDSPTRVIEVLERAAASAPGWSPRPIPRRWSPPIRIPASSTAYASGSIITPSACRSKAGCWPTSGRRSGARASRYRIRFA